MHSITKQEEKDVNNTTQWNETEYKKKQNYRRYKIEFDVRDNLSKRNLNIKITTDLKKIKINHNFDRKQN